MPAPATDEEEAQAPPPNARVPVDPAQEGDGDNQVAAPVGAKLPAPLGLIAHPAAVQEEDPRIRRYKAMQAVQTKLKSDFEQDHPFAPSGSYDPTRNASPEIRTVRPGAGRSLARDSSGRIHVRDDTERVITGVLKASDVGAKEKEIADRRAALEAKRVRNDPRRAQAAGTGQRTRVDEWGETQAVLDPDGKPLYHVGQWEEGLHPDTKLPVLQRRGHHGEVETKHPVISASPNLSDPGAYYKAQDGTYQPYGDKSLEELKNHPDFGVARMAYRATTARNAAIHKEALAGMYQEKEEAQNAWTKASEQYSRIAQRAAALQSEIAGETDSDKMEAKQSLLDHTTEQMTELDAQTKKGGALELAQRQAVLHYKAALHDQKIQSYNDSAEEIQARIKAGQPMVGDDERLAQIQGHIAANSNQKARAVAIAAQEKQAASPAPKVPVPHPLDDAQFTNPSTSPAQRLGMIFNKLFGSSQAIKTPITEPTPIIGSEAAGTKGGAFTLPKAEGTGPMAGLMNATNKFVAGMTSPENVGLLVATGGAGELATIAQGARAAVAARAAQAATLGTFTALGAKDTVQAAKEAKRVLTDPGSTRADKADAVATAVLSGVMTLAAGMGTKDLLGAKGGGGSEPRRNPARENKPSPPPKSMDELAEGAEAAQAKTIPVEKPAEKPTIVQEPITPAQKSALAIHQGLKEAEALRSAPEGGKLLKAQLGKESKGAPADELKAVAQARAEQEPPPSTDTKPTELAAVGKAGEAASAERAGREIAGTGVSPEAQGRAEIAAREATPVNIGPRDSTVSTGTGVPTAKEKTMLAEQQRLVDEHLAEQKQPTEKPTHALPVEKSGPLSLQPAPENRKGVRQENPVDQGAAGAQAVRPEGKGAVREEVAPAPLDTGEKKPPAQMKPAERVAELQAAGIKEVNGKPLTGPESANAAEIINAVGKLRKGKPDLAEQPKPTKAEIRLARHASLEAHKFKLDPTEIHSPTPDVLYKVAHNAAIDFAQAALKAGYAVQDIIDFAIRRFKGKYPGHTPEDVARLETTVRSALEAHGKAQEEGAKAQPAVTGVPAKTSTTGIAHRVSEVRGVEAERGEGISASDSVKHGRELLSKGFDAEKGIADFSRTKAVTADAVAAARAHAEELAKASNLAADQHGTDSAQYKTAWQAERDWIEKVKPMQTEWHKIGQAQQGETEIDTGTFHGLQKAYFESSGKDFTEKQAIDAKRIAGQVKGAADAATEAQDKLLKEVATQKKTADSVANADKLVRNFNPGEKWTPEEAKALWHLAKTNYLDKGINDINDIRAGLATDYGLSKNDIYEGLASPKGARPLTDDMYAKMAERRRVIQQAKQWVAEAKYPGYEKIFRAIPNAFFNLATFGHGTVWTVTHAGNQYFLPKATGQLFKDLGRSFKLMGVRDGGAYHERMMQDLVRDPNFIAAKRAGLANDPFKYQDDYQNAGMVTLFKDIGLMGNRGFDGMKLFRQFRFNQEWSTMPDSLRTPESAKLLADDINKATGITKSSRLPNWMNTAFFAPKLEVSRWAFLYADPARDAKSVLHSLYDPQSVSPEIAHAARRDLRQKVAIAGTYMSALALNQALLAAIGSKQQINFTNPRSGDWLSFKVFGHNVGVVGPMINSVRFLQNIAHDFWGERSKLEQMQATRGSEAVERAGEYARGKLSPFAGIAFDVASQSDAIGRPMPWSKDPLSYRAKLAGEKARFGYGEYASKKMLPIPLEEAATDIWRHQGAAEDDMSKWMRAIIIGAAAGTTGARITPEAPAYIPKRKPAPVP